MKRQENIKNRTLLPRSAFAGLSCRGYRSRLSKDGDAGCHRTPIRRHLAFLTRTVESWTLNHQRYHYIPLIVTYHSPIRPLNHPLRHLDTLDDVLCTSPTNPSLNTTTNTSQHQQYNRRATYYLMQSMTISPAAAVNDNKDSVAKCPSKSQASPDNNTTMSSATTFDLATMDALLNFPHVNFSRKGNSPEDIRSAFTFVNGRCVLILSTVQSFLTPTFDQNCDQKCDVICNPDSGVPRY